MLQNEHAISAVLYSSGPYLRPSMKHWHCSCLSSVLLHVTPLVLILQHKIQVSQTRCICCIKDVLVTVLWPIHTAEHVSQQLTNMFPDVLVNTLVNISVANSNDVVWCDNFRQQKASDKVLATACVAAFLCPFFFFKFYFHLLLPLLFLF